MAGTKKSSQPPKRPNPVHRPAYRAFAKVLREMRGDLTIRDLATIMKRPHSWVHRCETGDRRMDVLEFLEWCKACEVDFAEAAEMLSKKR